MKIIRYLGVFATAGLLPLALVQGEETPICNDILAYATPDQKISPDLCKELKTKEDSDFISIQINLKSSPVQTDSIDPKNDSIKPPDIVKDTTTPPYLVETTRLLFSTFELRDPAQPSRRLPVPGKVEFSYPNLIATKATIFLLSQADYISGIELWVKPQIVGLRIKRPIRLQIHHGTNDYFNLMGQWQNPVHGDRLIRNR